MFFFLKIEFTSQTRSLWDHKYTSIKIHAGIYIFWKVIKLNTILIIFMSELISYKISFTIDMTEGNNQL